MVNNAGIGVNAPVRRLFGVDFFGHIAVIQALLPALIRSKGRVVNISSVRGKITMATYGPSAGTKFALEAVSYALRREIEPLGVKVKVIVIEPGQPDRRAGRHDTSRSDSQTVVSAMAVRQRCWWVAQPFRFTRRRRPPGSTPIWSAALILGLLVQVCP